MLYEELDRLIEDYNERYRNANDWIFYATTELELEEAKVNKAQLVNDYSQSLYDF